MAELKMGDTSVDDAAKLKRGSTRDFLGHSGHKATEPGLSRAARFADAVGWTLTQFYHGSDKLRLRLHVAGETKGEGMWASYAGQRPKIRSYDLPTEGLVSIEISKEFEVPQMGLRAGDVVVGNKVEGRGIGNYVRTECIIEAVDGSRYLGVLHAGTKKGRFSVQPLDSTKAPITDIEVAWAAPISMVLRGAL